MWVLFFSFFLFPASVPRLLHQTFTILVSLFLTFLLYIHAHTAAAPVIPGSYWLALPKPPCRSAPFFALSFLHFLADPQIRRSTKEQVPDSQMIRSGTISVIKHVDISAISIRRAPGTAVSDFADLDHSSANETPFHCLPHFDTTADNCILQEAGLHLRPSLALTLRLLD